jgi:hypothetical protein
MSWNVWITMLSGVYKRSCVANALMSATRPLAVFTTSVVPKLRILITRTAKRMLFIHGRFRVDSHCIQQALSIYGLTTESTLPPRVPIALERFANICSGQPFRFIRLFAPGLTPGKRGCQEV